ncbi:MAG TPA: type II toxin-antitoxin system VapC family toxin [Actinomycetota bacterium]|nr:type II toxin-antitoxin system VapC family toxin [Actinomycetota bacterium]
MSAARRRRAGPPFLFDTHVWFWYLVGSDRLPPGLRHAIDDALGELWLSPISVWELCVLDERGRVRLAPDRRSWVEEALARLPLEEAPLNREVALVSREVRLAHRDPADRFLAATALVFGLTLLTVDERLTEARGIPTRSS